MKVLHIVGNKIESSNGIGRLLPEMIEMQNKYSENMECALCCVNDVYNTSAFTVINKYEMNDKIIDDYDVFIFHGLYFYSYISLAKKILSRNKLYFVKPHSSLIISAQKKSFAKKIIANFAFFRRFIKSASAVIFTNEDEAKNSVQWNSNSFYEGNGLSSVQVPDLIVRKKHKPYKFVYLSRIDFTHKGTDILLDALQLLKDKYKLKNLNLSIYGKGDESEESELIQRIQKLNFPDVTFNGPIYGKEKNRMLYEKDIFILSSRYEGFPMAILEALDSGLPCLVTRGVNMTTIIEKHQVGWECETTIQGVAELILSVLNTDETLIDNMSAHAREYIIKEHNWPSLVNYSESTYTDIYKRNM
ncbi:glycosyltransferase [Enterobacter sp. RHBSTW-00901]|uniref:glycosyltransferase n=1 Tax=Enterobacter sp. RHBSTW-00901 TaxID=2742669 RepID=UPI0015F6054A|nr:glycosyltransferase [Enterobacter sp. RHBSTW-00901]MBA7854552.1 glycosyltransferase [Enterobacter sp. RHBSTW-00901]